MKRRVGVFTEDRVLYNKLRLLLRDLAEVVLLNSGDSLPCDITFEDIDTSSATATSDSIRMSRTAECDLRLPFRHEDVIALIKSCDGSDNEYITMSGDGRHVYLGEEKIKLTDVEYRLLMALMSSEADFVTREALLADIWGDGFDAGVVNVYVHYLRQKLEKNGKKIILSSRKEGYGVDKKYRRDR